MPRLSQLVRPLDTQEAAFSDNRISRSPFLPSRSLIPPQGLLGGKEKEGTELRSYPSKATTEKCPLYPISNGLVLFAAVIYSGSEPLNSKPAD